MNGAQKIILGCFIVAALLIGLFPPWQLSAMGSHHNIGFHFLLSPPHSKFDWTIEATIVTSQLTVEWVTLLLVSGGLLFLFKDVSLKGVMPFLSRLRYRINHPFESRK